MYDGLDVHKLVCYGTVMTHDGEVVKRASFTNDPERLLGFMEGLDEAMVVMEAGYRWQPLFSWLEGSGHHMELAHPTNQLKHLL